MTMNAQELATALNGREYGEEITRAEEKEAKAAGLVVVFGVSDDLMEFRGAVHDEWGVYSGDDVYFTHAGLLVNKCNNDECPYFERLKNTAITITTKWDADEDYLWIYNTLIPHSTFDILEDGKKYCRGIVFALSDIPASDAAYG